MHDVLCVHMYQYVVKLIKAWHINPINIDKYTNIKRAYLVNTIPHILFKFEYFVDILPWESLTSVSNKTRPVFYCFFQFQIPRAYETETFKFL